MLEQEKPAPWYKSRALIIGLCVVVVVVVVAAAAILFLRSSGSNEQHYAALEQHRQQQAAQAPAAAPVATATPVVEASPGASPALGGAGLEDQVLGACLGDGQQVLVGGQGQGFSGVHVHTA